MNKQLITKIFQFPDFLISMTNSVTLLKTIPLSFRKFLFSSLFSFCLLSTANCLLCPITAAADQPKKICLRETCLNVEVADTDIERARGLQGRESLGDDYGMLFAFETQGMYNFWMKDTLISLDMIWIDQAHKIVDIKTDVPPCKADPCEIYVPAGESQYVLETKAGLSRVLKFKVGDELTFQ